MNLTSFKKNAKLAAAFTFMIVYAAAFFLLGKSSNSFDLSKVKGASSEREIKTPLNSPVPFADTQTSTITSSYVKLCANTIYSFEVAYPKDWFTTYSADPQKCTFFAPYSFVIPGDTTNFTTTVKISIIDPKDWPGTAKFYENPNDFQNVISTKNIAVNGKSVEKIEAETTGTTQNEKGLTKVSYLIQDSEKPAVISYQQAVKDEDIVANEKVLEDIVTSFRYF